MGVGIRKKRIFFKKTVLDHFGRVSYLNHTIHYRQLTALGKEAQGLAGGGQVRQIHSIGYATGALFYGQYVIGSATANAGRLYGLLLEKPVQATKDNL
jgi:hypothetical protein